MICNLIDHFGWFFLNSDVVAKIAIKKFFPPLCRNINNWITRQNWLTGEITNQIK